MGVPVDRGMTHDGLGKYLSQVITKAPGSTADVVGILRERKVDLMVSYLPVGSEEPRSGTSSRPSALASASSTRSVFIDGSRTGSDASPRGVAVIGDDIKSQVGRRSRTAS